MALGDLPTATPLKPLETLEAEITTLAAQLSAATYRLLELIAEFDRRQGWGGFGMRYYWDEDGCLVIKGRLPADQGALVVKALEAADEALRADEVGGANAGADSSAEVGKACVQSGVQSGVQPAWVERQADALTLVAETLLAETLLAHGARGLPAGDRHLVSVH